MDYNLFWNIGIGVISAIVIFVGTRKEVEYLRNENKKLADENLEQWKEINELKEFKNKRTPQIDHFNKIEEAYGKKIDKHGKDLVEVQQQLTQVVTIKEVRDEFVPREVLDLKIVHFKELTDIHNNNTLKVERKVDELLCIEHKINKGKE